MGDILAVVGAQDDAITHYSQSLAAARAVGAASLAAEALTGLAAIWSDRSDHERAFRVIVPLLTCEDIDREVKVRRDGLAKRLEEALPEMVVQEIRVNAGTKEQVVSDVLAGAV